MADRPSWCICDPAYADRCMEDPACRHDLLAAIDALHRPVVVPAMSMACYNGHCDHDDECPEIEVTVCSECMSHTECVTDEWFPKEVEWPCATARILHPEDGA